MASVQDRDLGWRRIKREIAKTARLEVVVGVHQGAGQTDGVDIAEYAADNEFGTDRIPSRPAHRIAFDENVSKIAADLDQQGGRIVTGQATADQSLTIIGQKHADRIKNTITGRQIDPPLSPATVARKGSDKTLVDTSAMVNSIHPKVRGKTR